MCFVLYLKRLTFSSKYIFSLLVLSFHLYGSDGVLFVCRVFIPDHHDRNIGRTKFIECGSTLSKNVPFVKDIVYNEVELKQDLFIKEYVDQIRATTYKICLSNFRKSIRGRNFLYNFSL